MPSGTLDPGFGNDGKVITEFGGDALAKAVAIQADGKIVLAGSSNDGARDLFALARYNADGSPDAMFGTSGIVSSRVGTSAEVQAVVLQPDGKLVAAGLAFITEPRCALARYNANGTLDEGFGNSGVVLVGVTVEQSPFGFFPLCGSVAVQADGKIVTALNGVGPIIALRFNADGNPDPSFGANGVAKSPYGGWFTLLKSRVVVLPDGNTVVVATALSSSPDPTKSGTYGVALARFGPDGIPDSGFGLAGLNYLPDAIGIVNSVRYPETGEAALLADGRIVAAVGEVLGFLPSGALDPNFNRQVDHPLGTNVTSMALQPDGKIVAVAKPGFRVFRLMPDGGLDLTFGDSRVLDTIIGAGGDANAVAIQRDGRIVVAGEVATAVVDPAGNPATRWNFGVARYIGDPVAIAGP